MKKRILSVLLCLCMALVLLPTTALAEETPLLYAKLALKENGLQDYADAMSEFN